MAVHTPKPIHSLVLDAGPIIKNEVSVSTLLSQAEQIYSIPSVINEIRDPASRSRIETTLLPFLTQRAPRPSSVKTISDFARQTGDLEVLSRPDIHLMALTYELECERNHGDWRLRSVPGQKKLNGSPPDSLKHGTIADIHEKKPVQELRPAPVPESRGAWGTAIPEPEKETVIKSEEEVVPVSIETAFESVKISSSPPAESCDLDASVKDITEGTEVDGQFDVQAEETQYSDDDEDDGGGWITPSNLKKHLAKDAGSTEQQEESKTMQVAIMTSDFAMQNVLLRMNLNLLSTSLQRVRHLKTFAKRCHACFFVCKDQDKSFCPRCGKDTMMKVSCSTDKDGNFKIHLKKNMQWNNRGNVYSIPKPVAGTSNGKLVAGGGKGGWGQGLILAEDQKEYVRAVTTERRRKEKDLMDEDYLPSILSGDRRSGGRPRVGAGKNVNSKRRH